MGSESKELREKQLEKATATFETYKASLSDKGITGKDASKNTIYRQLEASVKKAKQRIKAIDARAAHVAAMKAKETKGEKKARAKKAAAAPEPAGKAKNKNQKKKKK